MGTNFPLIWLEVNVLVEKSVPGENFQLLLRDLISFVICWWAKQVLAMIGSQLVGFESV